MMRLTLILLSFLILALPSLAQTPPPAAASPAGAVGMGAEEIEQWRKTLLGAQERVDGANQQVALAQQAYRDARKRKRRGGERAELLEALKSAEQELADAESALPELLDEARRAGVPPGVLREFED
jgi:chromosome segregation ATPase